jgi:hypothetical protein
MALFQFACPHCNQPFEIEDPPAGQAVHCPHCQDLVGLPDELAPALYEPARAADTSSEAERAEPESPFANIDFRDERTSILRPRRWKRKKRVPKKTRNVVQLSRNEKRRRQQRRSLFMMVFGLVVLFVAVVVLSRF